MSSLGYRFLLVTWEGGGNVAVMSGIGVALARRGHAVTIAAPLSIRESMHQLGLGFTALGSAAPTDARDRLDYLIDVADGSGWQDKLPDVLEAVRPDALVVDCNLAWALAQRRTHRTAVVVHTALGLYLPAWQQVLDAVNLRRAAAGRPDLPAAATGWAAADRLLVMSLSAFDRSGSVQRLRPRYLGPVADPRGALADAPVIAAQPDRPLVVVSHSTDALQNDAPRLQRSLDALADLPVLVLTSTSGVLAAGDLQVPQNANVVDFLPMDLVLTRASLLVCHAGHGTTMAALRHGVPLVAIPGIGRDQAPIAERVAELGLGLALSHNASTQQIAAAARAVLLDQQYRERASAFADRAAQSGGADRAAVELEQMCRNRRETR